MPELNHAKHVGTAVTIDGADVVLTTTTASIGAATEAQGLLADTALQPGVDVATLGSGSATAGHVAQADGSGGISWAAPATPEGTYDVSLGTVAVGTCTIDLNNRRNVTAYGVFSDEVGLTTLAFSNAPSGTVIVTLVLRQAGTNSHTVSYPPNTSFLNGWDGAVDPRANQTSVITLVTTSGASAWLAAIADTRGAVFEPYVWNPDNNGSFYLPFAQTEILDLVNVVQTGTGTITWAKSDTLGGSFTNISSPTSSEVFYADNVLRATVTGFSGHLAFRVARVG